MVPFNYSFKNHGTRVQLITTYWNSSAVLVQHLRTGMRTLLKDHTSSAIAVRLTGAIRCDLLNTNAAQYNNFILVTGYVLLIIPNKVGQFYGVSAVP